ncbi:SdpI family protein [Intestinibacillus massiliensis]|uniref:SdpI family protein n=1 Tax=Intestinibacillus massiliensis TaxID=1871029 RepID=UPI000B35C5A0|nr:SdpI family protein [Intestinibacillus massiliensis]
MKKLSRMQIAVWVLAAVPVLAVALCYGSLPAQVPMHWGLSGVVSYGEKWQLWLIAGMAPLLAVLFPLLPKIDPRRRSYDKFMGSYLVFQLVMMLFLAVMTGIVLAEGLRPGLVDVGVVVCALVSLLFIILGNMMPKFRPNWFFGIKNPWTISSEAVWVRTHRMGGRLLFAAGVLGLLGCFLPPVPRFAVLIGAACAAVLLPSVMSFFWYRSEQQNG